MKCARCGRHLDRLEGRIGDQDYCHPDNPELPDCYEICCHEQVRTVHLTDDIIRRELNRWHSLLEELRQQGD
jgi:glutathione S-transferase